MITNRPLTVVSLMLSLFMGAMEMTVVSTAMPTVIGDLGGIHLYSWVFTAYMLASTVTVPIYGKLADLYGRKPVMFFGMALFLLGSMASGQAHSMNQLIAFRAIQGLGAGAMQPTSLTIVGDLFNAEERGRMQGLFGAVWGVAAISGPTLGGLIVHYFSWRWIFYINVPVGLLAATLLSLALHEKIERRPHRLDFVGALLLVAALLAFLVGERSGPHMPWVLAAAVVATVLFVVVERGATEPLLPLPLFRKPAMAISTLAGALVGGAMTSTVTFLPLYIQAVMGGSPTAAGSAITPMVMGWPVGSTLSGRLLGRVGYRPLIRLGLFISAAAALGLALLLAPTMSLRVPQIATALFGVGLGFTNTSLLIAVQSSVEWKERGIATASTMFSRTIGGTLAVGAAGGILAAALARDPSIPAGAADELLGPDHGRHLDTAATQGLVHALGGSVGTIFWMIAGITLTALVASWFFPDLGAPKTRAGAAGAARNGLNPKPVNEHLTSREGAA